MTQRRTWTALFAATLGLVVLSNSFTQSSRAQSAQGYTLIDLGSLGGGDTQAFDLNDSTQVIGYSRTSALQSRAFLWDAGQMANLGVVNADDFRSAAVDLNTLGDAVGTSTLKNGFARAALFRNGSAIALTPELPPYEGTSFASAINDHGHIVGAIDDDDSYFYQGVLWANGSRTDLGHLGLGTTRPADINNVGQVVGTSSTTDGLGHAFLWENGAITDLGVVEGDHESAASAINANGVIVGTSGRIDESYQQRPFIYENGAMRAIPVQSSEAYATDINDAGVVVGIMRTGGTISPYHAWIYVDGVVTNLNSLISSGSGLHLAYANAINNNGEIVGLAYDAQGQPHGFLLRPGDPGDPPPPPPPPPPPSMVIDDVSRLEGRNGTTNFTFTVRLSAAAPGTVTVNFATVNGTAIAGSDYTAASGTLVFNPGETARTVNVAVKGDRTREADETFTVQLSAANGATIADGTGLGVIRNDDR
jgi:probable HAF family extracellular repeat protein